MAMESPPIPHGDDGADDDDDDNDGFDWEAAVREIDTACAAAAVAASSTQAGPYVPAAGGGDRSGAAKARSKARQSTLDRFVDSYQKSRTDPNRSRGSLAAQGDARDDGGRCGGDEVVSISIDLEAAGTWIYPINVPMRDYQFSITKSALFSNTLVALPTGLGKTLIAAVVMYNYFRWFPDGKIVFAAPSRPLVLQQIEACHNIVGIPQEWTIDMTGQMNPSKRSSLWKDKRVFFVTPQVLERDIQSGICMVKQLVCLVIDEAHRALGNYSYCVAVRELMAASVQLRVLALTATPGSKQRTIQNVIDNLCISTLEYRNESDADVSPYVHDRKLEVIEVALSKDVVGVNNLLLAAVQPFVVRLCALGVLYNRDVSMLSPCELLNSRDKFRQAPPATLPQANFGEIEGCFGVLITLYHIRKLLTSHGIRPAFEMLEEKLKQGSFARLMSRNETIWKTKLLMQQSLSQGSPNPKIVKLMDILIDHFKTKDPKDSRVIIFSNFRGSVKDIMESLSHIGDLVKATEFVGQSSGKSLKGQTQKVQQAVLQKFRSGGYNVIVATSIGEEGLDIMEVDLVVCFDANVSPLRMIQRMGRTGRNHEGRVVVLASEGSELKGYLKKQAGSKAVRKHMHNGGIKSFDFHSSPRMVPHICKPQVQFVELSIEQFVPRGRKGKANSPHGSSVWNKISNEEREVIARYFPTQDNAWKPSLIAFPHFQAFPSAIYKVCHSFRTTAMLIDGIQHLQGLPLAGHQKVETSMQSLGDLLVLDDYKDEKGPGYVNASSVDAINIPHAVKDDPNALIEEEIPEIAASPCEISGRKIEHHIPDPLNQKTSGHCFLFDENFVTVDPSGSVSIASVPFLTIKGFQLFSSLKTKCDKELSDHTNRDACFFEESPIDHGKPSMCLDCLSEEAMSTIASQLSGYGAGGQHASEKFAFQIPVLELQGTQDCATEVHEATENGSPVSSGANAFRSMEATALSPRLTYFIEEGIVPESPSIEMSHLSSRVNHMVGAGFAYDIYTNKLPSKKLFPEVNALVLIDVPSCSPKKFENVDINESLKPSHVLPTLNKLSDLETESYSILDRINLDGNKMGPVQNAVRVIDAKDNVPESPVNEEICTPLAKPANNSSSKEWQWNSGELLKSLRQAPKYKRLRKYGGVVRDSPCKLIKENSRCSVECTCEPTERVKLCRAECNKGRKAGAKRYMTAFVEDEAEVSDDAEVSEDEKDNEDDNQYDDSFIDDRVNPTYESSQAEKSGDMMAFYRRSLLSQSPSESQPTCLGITHENHPKTAEKGSCSSKTISNFLGNPENCSKSGNLSTNRNSFTSTYSEKAPMTTMPVKTSVSQKESRTLESRKRKLSFQHSVEVPAVVLLQGARSNQFSDDDFYQNIDLDAVEAQAAKIFRCRSELWTGDLPRHSVENKLDHSSSVPVPPSFDLGI